MIVRKQALTAITCVLVFVVFISFHYCHYLLPFACDVSTELQIWLWSDFEEKSKSGTTLAVCGLLCYIRCQLAYAIYCLKLFPVLSSLS